MPKPRPKKKKKVSYETRIRRLKEYRANLSDEQKKKIKEYNRARSLKARANETPLAREMRLQKSRESARMRRSKKKAQVEKEMRKLGLIPPKQPLPNALSPSHPGFNYFAQMNFPGNNNLPSGFIKTNPNDQKILGTKPSAVKPRPDRVLPAELPLPYINYKPTFPMHMSMPPMNMSDDYDDMATVCPIECNVDITPEPVQKFKQPTKLISESPDEMIVKNIGAHVVLKKKVVNRAPSEDVRILNGASSDWNGTASVCPIECNVDITDPSEAVQHPPEIPSATVKRNSLLDTLKQMGTHVIIKKKGEVGDKNLNVKSTANKNDFSRILPAECNVDIKPVESRLKASEITIVKHNGSNNIKKLGSQIMMQKIVKPPAPVQQRGYESPEECYDDYDMPCPIECNVDISESS